MLIREKKIVVGVSNWSYQRNWQNRSEIRSKIMWVCVCFCVGFSEIINSKREKRQSYEKVIANILNRNENNQIAPNCFDAENAKFNGIMWTICYTIPDQFVFFFRLLPWYETIRVKKNPIDTYSKFTACRSNDEKIEPLDWCSFSIYPKFVRVAQSYA